MQAKVKQHSSRLHKIVHTYF